MLNISGRNSEIALRHVNSPRLTLTAAGRTFPHGGRGDWSIKMKVRRSLLVVFAVAFPTASALAADVVVGEQLARRWCSDCHLVARNQTPAGDAPPFTMIARRPDFNAAGVAFFLLDPHPKMPDMGLSRKAAEDLAAYIATLK